MPERNHFRAAGLSRRDWWARARREMRVAEGGETVLVHYENRNRLASITFGHSVYTRPEWLSFHLDLISDMYAAKNR